MGIAPSGCLFLVPKCAEVAAPPPAPCSPHVRTGLGSGNLEGLALKGYCRAETSIMGLVLSKWLS